MALIGNISQISNYPIRHSAYNGANERSMWGLLPMNHLLRCSTFDKRNATPWGYYPPYTWDIAIKAGGISSTASIYGSGNIISTYMAGLFPFLATTEIVGSGDISSAIMRADLFLQATTKISGSGDITTAIVRDFALGFITAALSGSGDLTSNISAIANILTNISSGGDLSIGFNHAIGSISANLGVSTEELSPSSIADKVWSTLAAAFNSPGTMGQQINNVGAGANPWTAPIEGSYTAEEILRILFSVAAGKTIVTNEPGGHISIKFRDVNDSVDRVEADVLSNQRTSVTINKD